MNHWSDMMIKGILLLLTLFFTGCSIEYNVTLNDKIDEQIIISNISLDSYNLLLNKSFMVYLSDDKKLVDSSAPEFYSSFPQYNKKDISRDNIYNIEYFHNFDLDKYTDSNAANTCYQFFSVTVKDNEVSILTGNKFYCFDSYEELDSVTVNINSNYKVIQSNADKIVGKKHTWIITPENASNKPIIFVYDKSKKNMTIMQYLIDNFPLVVVVSVVFALCGITFLVINLKKKKANKI